VRGASVDAVGMMAPVVVHALIQVALKSAERTTSLRRFAFWSAHARVGGGGGPRAHVGAGDVQ
jgi:hypothetical protein